METKNSIKGSEFNAKPFKVVYITLFAFILIFDILITVLLFTVWANLEVITYVFFNNYIWIWMYFVFLISPIFKMGFEVYELVRFRRVLKSSNQDKESAINVAKGFKGTRIYRIFYLVQIAGLIVWMEIFDFISKVWGGSGYSVLSKFYWWFAILLFIHILPIIVGPEIIKFSIDYTNKKNKIKMILGIILWTILLILVLNLDFFILLVSLIISKT